MAKKYNLPFDRIENLGLKTYKQVITLNREVERRILSVNPRIQTAVIPNGLDRAIVENYFKKQLEHILFLGRLDFEQKGLDLLLDAWSKTGTDFLKKEKLVIAGGGQESANNILREKIKSLGLEDKVEVIGKTVGKKKEELFKNAKFFVMCSRFETFPLTILEAFAFSCPVVLFDIENLKWVPEACAIKIPPFDSQKFGQAMAELAKDPELISTMGQNAKDFVKQYTWENITKKYSDFLNTIEIN
jgi:glycosyltransferase involved in cell wall biosynthesis